MSNVETRINVRARFYIKKSFGLMHTIMVRVGEMQMKTSNSAGFSGLGPKVKSSWDQKVDSLVPIEFRTVEKVEATKAVDPVSEVQGQLKQLLESMHENRAKESQF